MNSCEFLEESLQLTLKKEWEGCVLSTHCFNPSRFISYIYMKFYIYIYIYIYIYTHTHTHTHILTYILASSFIEQPLGPQYPIALANNICKSTTKCQLSLRVIMYPHTSLTLIPKDLSTCFSHSNKLSNKHS